MLTAAWNAYSGPGRVAVSPVPPEIPRGYRRHAGLTLVRPASAAELRTHLATLDARKVAAELHALVYPHEPVLMGEAPAGARSYRSELARWLSFGGVPVAELDPATHRPRRVHPTSVPGLRALLSA